LHRATEVEPLVAGTQWPGSGGRVRCRRERLHIWAVQRVRVPRAPTPPPIRASDRCGARARATVLDAPLVAGLQPLARWRGRGSRQLGARGMLVWRGREHTWARVRERSARGKVRRAAAACQRRRLQPPGGFTLPLGGLFSVAIGADGSPGPVARITNTLVPFARDGGGDQVLGASAGFLP